MSGFTSYMNTLPVTVETVMISVVENFVVDAVGADVVEPDNSIAKCLDDFLGVIQNSVVTFPSVKFGVVLPLGRPGVKWYQERLDNITETISDGIKKMIAGKKVNNVASIECVAEGCQQFEADGIHLTKASAKIFFEVILKSAEIFFTSEMVDLTEAGEISDVDGDQDGGRIGLLEDRLKRLESAMRFQSDKNVGNDLMFARLREETDATTNKAKEDRLVINGLKSAAPLPTDQRLRIEALKTLASKIFEILIPGFSGKIVYLSQGKQQGQPIPMIEVKMDKPEQALALRKAYAEKKKNRSLGSDLELLFISNCVSLATRVRIDIMKAVAKKLTNKVDLAYVAGFTSRPMLHIRKAGPPSASAKPLKSFSFIDTITKFGNNLTVEELESAYGRAGRSFNGQLQQVFVVLNEHDSESLQSVSRPSDPGASGRGGRAGASGVGGSGPHSDKSRGKKRSGSEIASNASKK
jgi:hypothetical protein